jgi:hypothetical protein
MIMPEDKTYETDGIPELMSYLSFAVDHKFGMRNHRLRDDVISESLMLLYRAAEKCGDFRRNRSAIRYAILKARRNLGISFCKDVNRGNHFWNYSVSFDCDMVAHTPDGEDGETILERYVAPENLRESALKTLRDIAKRLKGKDLVIFKMLSEGCDRGDIARKFKVSRSMADIYRRELIKLLRREVRAEYDCAESILDDMHAERVSHQPEPQTVDNSDGTKRGKRRDCPPGRPKALVRRWRKVALPRHINRRDPEIIRTKRNYDRPRVRLGSRAGVAQLRDLGFFGAKTGI